MQLIQIIILNIISFIFLFNVSTKDSDFNIHKVYEIKDQHNRTIFYSSYINMYPCINDECKIMNLTMFWDKSGNYYKFEIEKHQALTKLNHKEFSTKDYLQLHKILLDTNSDFKFLALKDLTERQSENSFYETDAVSGATIKQRDFKCINGAVKTTYQLWHIANSSINDSIMQIYKIEPILYSQFSKKSIDEVCQLDIFQFMIYIDYLESGANNVQHINVLGKKILNLKNEKSLLFYNYLIRNKIKCKRKLKNNFINTIEFYN